MTFAKSGYRMQDKANIWKEKGMWDSHKKKEQECGIRTSFRPCCTMSHHLNKFKYYCKPKICLYSEKDKFNDMLYYKTVYKALFEVVARPSYY